MASLSLRMALMPCLRPLAPAGLWMGAAAAASPALRCAARAALRTVIGASAPQPHLTRDAQFAVLLRRQPTHDHVGSFGPLRTILTSPSGFVGSSRRNIG